MDGIVHRGCVVDLPARFQATEVKVHKGLPLVDVGVKVKDISNGGSNFGGKVGEVPLVSRLGVVSHFDVVDDGVKPVTKLVLHLHHVVEKAPKRAAMTIKGEELLESRRGQEPVDNVLAPCHEIPFHAGLASSCSEQDLQVVLVVHVPLSGVISWK